MCVCPSSETRRKKRDHSEGVKKGVHYGVPPFSGDDVDCCAGFVSEQEVRASESSEAENERGFFFCERDNRRILKDPETSNTHPHASSLDKEDGWEFAYLLHVTCAH